VESLVRFTDVLFGAAAHPDRPDSRWLVRYLALAGVLALVVFARRPDSILRPQFWAEDCRIFFYEQLTLGFWSASWKLYLGFPFLVQRIVAALADMVPTITVPLFYNASAIAITALTMASFSLPGFRHLVQSDGVRVAVCIATVCVPAGQELLATPTTLGYFLAIWLVFLSVMAVPRTLAGTAAWCMGGVLAVLSTPAAPVAAPLWMLRALRGVRRHDRPDLSFGLTQFAALLVTVGLVALRGSPGFGFRLHPGALRPALSALSWTMVACIDTAFLPMTVFEWLEAQGTLQVVVPAMIVAVCAALACRDLSQRGRVTLCLALYLFVSSLYLVLAGRPDTALLVRGVPLREIFKNEMWPDLHLRTFTILSPRYRVLPNAALVLVAASIIDGANRMRTRVAAGVACAGLLFAWTPEFRVPPFPDRNWPLVAARLDKKLASGSHEPLVIPSHPSFWDTTLDPAPQTQPPRAEQHSQH
jgi:hypothetical protein